VLGSKSVRFWINGQQNFKKNPIFRISFKERLNNKGPLLPCSFTATLPFFFVAMPHIAPQKTVDW
jgi:hypothetical protein